MTQGFGQSLRAERSGRRINQATLAKNTGLSIQTVVDIENDRIEITQDFYAKLIKALDAPTEQEAA